MGFSPVNMNDSLTLISDSLVGIGLVPQSLPRSINQIAYANAIIAKFSKLSGLVDSLDVEQRSSIAFGLKDIFVAQNVEIVDNFNGYDLDLPPDDIGSSRAHGQLDVMMQRKPSNARTEFSRQSVMEVLHDRSVRRCVILGDPGSGKSSALRTFALQWAKRSDSARDEFDFPILIELKERVSSCQRSCFQLNVCRFCCKWWQW